MRHFIFVTSMAVSIIDVVAGYAVCLHTNLIVILAIPLLLVVFATIE